MYHVDMDVIVPCTSLGVDARGRPAPPACTNVLYVTAAPARLRLYTFGRWYIWTVTLDDICSYSQYLAERCAAPAAPRPRAARGGDDSRFVLQLWSIHTWIALITYEYCDRDFVYFNLFLISHVSRKYRCSATSLRITGQNGSSKVVLG